MADRPISGFDQRPLAGVRDALRRHATLAVAVVITVVMGTGIGVAYALIQGSASQTPVPPPAASASESEQTRREAIAAAYREFERVVDRTARTNNPAPLDEVATGRALRMLEQAYRQREQVGKVGYGRTKVNVIGIEIHGARKATVHTCNDNSSDGLEDASTGEILTVGRERQEGFMRMRRVGGQWKVSLSQVVKGGGKCYSG